MRLFFQKDLTESGEEGYPKLGKLLCTIQEVSTLYRKFALWMWAISCRKESQRWSIICGATFLVLSYFLKNLMEILAVVIENYDCQNLQPVFQQTGQNNKKWYHKLLLHAELLHGKRFPRSRAQTSCRGSRPLCLVHRSFPNFRLISLAALWQVLLEKEPHVVGLFSEKSQQEIGQIKKDKSKSTKGTAYQCCYLV